MLTATQMDNHASDSLFRMLDQGKKKTIESDLFIGQLARKGILSDDPRIQELLKIFEQKESERRCQPQYSRL
ncbi:hypothetical protein [Flagellimonas amoyensis]|uniref:hypothetical protein n=1 Tax=Flagellimonas amoyensis TaxID=2169401 RepID=UPI00131F1FDB|nr:hypothetical protein [Allomuricauda amoyensis]